MAEGAPPSAPSILTARHVHLVGIGGAGMSALGTLLLRQGKTVSGSDLSDGLAAAALRAAGATVFTGHAAAHIHGADYVVRSSAVLLDNPEVSEAQAHALPVRKLSEAVGELASVRQAAVIAGTHGKTTTTALVAWLLDQGGLDPAALIGGVALNFGESARVGDGPLVIEGDEYDRRFLELSAEVAVVTSVEPDHLDYFRDFSDIEGAFRAFVDRVRTGGRLILCADDAGAAALALQAGDRVICEMYGLAGNVTWGASAYQPRPEGGSQFTLEHGGRAWPARLALIGEHNVRNALAAVAVADYFGMGLRSILAALPTFLGTRRRFEEKGRPRGVRIIDDYAHHPTAVRATLAAARSVCSAGRIWVVFQPHTTNRTAALLADFARALAAADHVLVLPIYAPAGREAAGRPVSSADLVDRLREHHGANAQLVADFQAATTALVGRVQPGDLVLTLGAGDVTQLADRLVRELEAA